MPLFESLPYCGLTFQEKFLASGNALQGLLLVSGYTTTFFINALAWIIACRNHSTRPYLSGVPLLPFRSVTIISRISPVNQAPVNLTKWL